jgi:hypothetical protein
MTTVRSSSDGVPSRRDRNEVRQNHRTRLRIADHYDDHNGGDNRRNHYDDHYCRNHNGGDHY